MNIDPPPEGKKAEPLAEHRKSKRVVRIIRDLGVNGAMFKCPGCLVAHGLDLSKGWTLTGELEAPTIRPDATVKFTDGPSKGERCHFEVTDGMIKFFEDSTHTLRGCTVALEPI